MALVRLAESPPVTHIITHGRQCLEQYQRICSVDCSQGLGQRLRDVLTHYNAQPTVSQSAATGLATGEPGSPGAALLQLFDNIFNKPSSQKPLPPQRNRSTGAGLPAVPPSQPLGPQLQARSTEELGVQAAMFSVAWVRQGALEAKCSSAFGKVFLTTEELLGQVRDQQLLVPYVWGRCI